MLHSAATEEGQEVKDPNKEAQEDFELDVNQISLTYEHVG